MSKQFEVLKCNFFVESRIKSKINAKEINMEEHQPIQVIINFNPHLNATFIFSCFNSHFFPK